MENDYNLIKKAGEGDRNARNTVVEQNMGLVFSVARHFSGRGEAEDLAQIGAIGLIKAAENFNLEFGVKFSTYAVPMIAGEIRRFLRDDGIIKVSRKLKENAAKAKKCEEALRKELKRDPTLKEISKESGICVEDIVFALEACTAPESIHEKVYEDIEMGEILGEKSHEEEIINKVLAQELLGKLKPRERQIIALRYFKGKTQTETAKIIGVSQVQISRLEKSILGKIRTENAL